MHVFCLCDLDELAPYADDWDRLSGGVPFRSWAWLSTWWRHYGPTHRGEPPRRRLFVACVFDLDDRLVGLAPWYLEDGGPSGRALRMLGCGEAASDYLSLLCQAGMEDRVARAVADYLTGLGVAKRDDPPRWDLLEIEGVDARDRAVNRLIEHLGEGGNTVHRRAGLNCWRIELPHTWDEYLAVLSKHHRKQLRRLQRNVLDGGRAVLRRVGQIDELPPATSLLIELHQRRRRALGEPGCFASTRFTAFHREVMPQLLRAGQLQLHWLELDGKPAAVEYQMAAGGVIYAYQAGLDPDCLDRQPGRLITLATLRRSIEQGYRAFDFLRGDEPYKAHWRARPRPSLAVRVVPHRTAARLRHGVWLAGRNVKRLVKSSLKLAGTCRSGNDSC